MVAKQSHRSEEQLWAEGGRWGRGVFLAEDRTNKASVEGTRVSQELEDRKVNTGRRRGRMKGLEKGPGSLWFCSRDGP